MSIYIAEEHQVDVGDGSRTPSRARSTLSPRQERQLRLRQTPRPATHRRRQNVNDTERLISLAGGGALILLGLARGSWTGLGLAVGGGMLLYRGVTGHCYAYDALGVNTAQRHGPLASVAAGRGIRVEHSVTVNAPPERVYEFWSRLENLPQFMKHLHSVERLEGNRWHWVASCPLGTHISWDAEVINQRPHEMISWRSLEGAIVDHAGSVHFVAAPGNRGTEVNVVLSYDPPGGKMTAAAARFLGQAPEQLIREDLRRFKQIIEAGEHATVSGRDPVG